jgi:tetratricopeptide (TPR) repeat protein
VEASREEIAASHDLAHVLRTANARRAAMPSVVMLLLGFAVLMSAGRAQPSGTSYRETVLLIQRHIEENDLDGARVMIAKASERFPTDGGLENLLGVVEIQQGHGDRARQAFSAAIKHSPKLVGAYMNLGRMDMQTAASDPSAQAEALHVYEKVLQMEPSNSEANYQSAALLMWTLSYQRSLEHLAKLSNEDRTQIGAEMLLCADEVGLGHKEAADHVAAALAANPELTEQDLMEILPALHAGHRADLVETILAAADGRHPLSAEGLRMEGLAQEAEGKLTQARATLERAFANDPASVVVLVDLSRVAEVAKDYQGALGYVAHARDLQPKDASLPYQFGAICLRLNLAGEARKALGEAVKLDPENPQYNFAMGIVSSYAQDPAEALPYLEKYHALRPADASGILELGKTYFRTNDFETASTWMKQAANDIDVGMAASAHYYLGRIARRQDRLDEAAAQLMQSRALKPDQAEVLAELGQVYVEMKKYPEAERELDRAVQLDAENYTANFGLLQIYTRTGDMRREEQLKRFRAIRDKNEEQYREMVRAIEIHPQGWSVEKSPK